MTYDELKRKAFKRLTEKSKLLKRKKRASKKINIRMVVYNIVMIGYNVYFVHRKREIISKRA